MNFEDYQRKYDYARFGDEKAMRIQAEDALRATQEANRLLHERVAILERRLAEWEATENIEGGE